MPKLDLPADTAGTAPSPPQKSGGPIVAAAPEELTIELSKLADQQDKINGLWYGPSGTGKTTSVAHLANYGRVIYVNAEGGLKKRPLQRLGIEVDNIDIFTLADYPQGQKFKALEALFWSIADKPPFGVLWDSVTEMHKILMREQVDRRVVRARTTGKGSDDPYFTDLADYGPVTEQLRILIRRFRDLDCHFGITALERRDVDQDTSSVKVGPAIAPAIQNDLFGYVDIVCHTEVGRTAGGAEYIGTFVPTGKYEAKDRFGVLPPYIINPTFDRVIDYVDGDLTLDTDPYKPAGAEEAPTGS